jgi:hypothetical protein
VTGRVLQEPCLRARFLATRADAGGASALWTGRTKVREGTSRRRDSLEDPAKRVTEGLARRVPQGRGYALRVQCAKFDPLRLP